MAAPTAIPDDEVVTRVLRGDLAVFEILMRRYNQRLFRVARAIVRVDAEAEDVVQQAYLSAYTHLRQFGGRSKFSTWLTRIAVNEALARTRHRVRLAEVELEVEDLKSMAANTRTPEETTSGHELGALVEGAIDGLEEPYRVVFMMREVEQLSVAETAECLEISEENVKVRLHRAKAMLREALFAKVSTAASGAFSFLGARCDRLVEAVMGKIRTL
jgi:RNA polymerase sigma-70 factor (ECF subfamily)